MTAGRTVSGASSLSRFSEAKPLRGSAGRHPVLMSQADQRPEKMAHMTHVSELDQALEEAQRVARMSQNDRLDGKLGDPAENAALRLLTAAGLDYTDAARLVSATFWAGWHQGWGTGYDHTRKTP